METNQMNQEQFIQKIVKNVMVQLQDFDDFKIPIGVSNRHVHVSREDLDTLFGKGYELTKKQI